MLLMKVVVLVGLIADKRGVTGITQVGLSPLGISAICGLSSLLTKSIPKDL